jgi:hypothetical protein
MQSRLWISAVLLVLSVSVQTAAAGPQEDVAAAGQKWATVFADNNPDTMLPPFMPKTPCCGARFHQRHGRTLPR